MHGSDPRGLLRFFPAVELVEERDTAARKQTGTFCTEQAGRCEGCNSRRRSSDGGGGEKTYKVLPESQMRYVKSGS